ncbi:hypothetical protein T492DRAFT_1138723 [Pavlovales sp. CCMP2436]|nr:hypothetical protein T492DRAFT_1138723 [Pavlovales sp. CCMP2436]
MYLPFNDGIYSFVDKKLYSYDELPDVNFTQKINRNFPKFNQVDHDEMMKRVLMPIYPNEEERTYNAYVTARALAGCFEDKKWYGYCGMRDSGKGTETKLLRKGFGAIIISNEIQGNEKTVLNGGFIKTLASGGDEMEGRLNYQNAMGCEPADASENLERFDYKKTRKKAPQSILDAINQTKDEETDDMLTYVTERFVTTENKDDRLHTQDIFMILASANYKTTSQNVGKIFNSIGIGVYDAKCNIDTVKKGGLKFVKFIEAPIIIIEND